MKRSFAALQVKLCHLQEWVKAKGPEDHHRFRGARCCGQGRHDQGVDRAGEPPRLSCRRAPGAFRPRKDTDVSFSATSNIFPLPVRSLSSTAVGTTALVSSASWSSSASRNTNRFLSLCPEVEQHIVDAGVTLIKFWLEVGIKEQEKRFAARVDDPLRQWKLSPMDVESYSRWYNYSRARDAMLKATDSKHAPWSYCPL